MQFCGNIENKPQVSTSMFFDVTETDLTQDKKTPYSMLRQQGNAMKRNMQLNCNQEIIRVKAAPEVGLLTYSLKDGVTCTYICACQTLVTLMQI